MIALKAQNCNSTEDSIQEFFYLNNWHICCISGIVSPFCNHKLHFVQIKQLAYVNSMEY